MSIAIVLNSKDAFAHKKLDMIENGLRTCHKLLPKIAARHIQQTLDCCDRAFRQIEGPLSVETESRIKLLKVDYDFLHAAIQEPPTTSTPPPLEAPIVCELAKPRDYLGFEHEKASITQSDAIPEFLAVLEQHGLHDKIRYEFSDEGILFHHSANELYYLMEKCEALRPFIQDEDGNHMMGRYGKGKKSVKGLGEEREKQLSRLGKMRNLVKEALDAFQQLPGLLTPVKCTIKHISLKSEKAILHEVLIDKNMLGICIGENHREHVARRFLIEHMKTLKEFGVTTVFMEGLQYDTMQKYLDAYFASPGEDMPAILESFLQHLDEKKQTEEPYRYIDIVRQAKIAGIRVVGLDTSLSAKISVPNTNVIVNRHIIRATVFNYLAEKIIQHEKGPGKFAALMGRAHGSLNSMVKNVPGVADLLQCPFFYMDESLDGTSAIEANKKAKWCFHAHVYIKRPSPFVDNP